MRRDLEGAGIAYRDDKGRFRDFHSFRCYFASMLVTSGINPKIAQAFMRHSTITLTMDLYAKLGDVESADRINSLPGLAARAQRADVVPRPSVSHADAIAL